MLLRIYTHIFANLRLYFQIITIFAEYLIQNIVKQHLFQFLRMKKILICTFVTLLVLLSVCAIIAVKSIVHVQLPHGAMLHVLPAFNNNKVYGAVVICPGGGYSNLKKWYEGYLWFPYFLKRGYTAAILEYRMPKGDYRIPMTDAAEAIRLMRCRADEWHFNIDNVGIMGFSAGGHLASTMLVTDNDSVRPNFGILFYPVISMKKELTHMDSHDQLLGKDASIQLEYQFSNELHVSEKTPPTFIAVTSDDKAAIPQNSIRFHDAMRAKKRPVSLFIYPSGGHGWVCQFTSEYRKSALDELTNWLNDRLYE